MRLALVLGLCCAACTTGEDRGPIHSCGVWSWTSGHYDYHGEEYTGCTCDPDFQIPPDAEWIEDAHGSASWLIAPPGTLPPSARAEVSYAGGSFEWFTFEDGSFLAFLSVENVDLVGTFAEVRVNGITYRKLFRVGNGSSLEAVQEPPFEGQLIVEDPRDTMHLRGTFWMPEGTEVTDTFTIPALYVSGLRPTWDDQNHESGDELDISSPGIEGQPFLFAALHESGAALCFGDNIVRCGCASTTREAGECRFQSQVTSPDEDAGVPDAGPYDAGAPF